MEAEQSRCTLLSPPRADELCHVVDYNNDDVALCGADVSAQPWCHCPDGVCRVRQECVVCGYLGGYR